MNNWVLVKDREGKDKILNIKDVDSIYIARFEGQTKEEDPFVVFGQVGSNFIHFYIGTQVECIRYFDKLKERLQPFEIQVWE